MKRKTWIGAGLGGVALVLTLAWAFAPRPVEVEVATVTQGRFETAIDEDGKTRIPDRYTVSAPLAGRLARITLREGDAVAADQVVATLTPVLPALQDERTQRELQARYGAAQENVQRAVSRRDRARVLLEQTRTELRRSEQLALQGFVAPTRLDADRLATQAALRETEMADAELRIAGHEREQARAALGALQPGTSAGPGFAVRSPVAGRVLRVLQPSAATVPLGMPLLELGDTARLEVVAELLTSDALAAQPGSRVRIDRWGGPVELQGRVRAVEPAAFTKVSALGVEEQRVRVLIDLDSPPALWHALGDGYRVGLHIVTLVQEAALQVPVSAVFPLPAAPDPAPEPAPAPALVPAPGPQAGASSAADASVDAQPTHAVFVFDGRRARQVRVVLGARNGSMAWVRSGLSPGQRVIVYPPGSVRDGVRVAPRQV